MMLRKSAVRALLLSLLIALAGAALLLFGGGVRFFANTGTMVDFVQLLLCAVAAVVFSFVFGALRYDLPSGTALMLASLHDFAVTFALVAILSLLLPQHPLLPAMFVMTAVFTYAQTIPVLRAVRELTKGTSLRDKNREEAAQEAAAGKGKQSLAAVAAVVLLLAAAVIGGGARLGAAILPLALALAVSCYSARLVTPYFWAAVANRMKARRPAR